MAIGRWPTAPPRERDDPDTDPERVARTILLRRLQQAPRTRTELAETLQERAVPPDVADRVLGRFEEAGLVDDRLFARMWVDSRQAGRGLSTRALREELRRKGVADDCIAEAVGRVTPEAELAAAREIVLRRASSLRGLPRPTQIRRLTGILARRGYSADVRARVVREVLDSAEGDPLLLDDDA
ncbi:MAG: regulatory protein RecX [Candidatus Nanopelagicales bacterium]